MTNCQPGKTYLDSLQYNLRHLDSLHSAPPRSLATTDNGLPPTEADSYLGPKVQWSEIPPGQAGTRTTLQTMARLAREAAAYGPFRRWAAAQFGSLDELDRWAREHFTYRDEDEEIIRSPILMLGDAGRIDGNRLVGIEGDCDDIATFLAAVTKTLKYPTRLMAIRYSNQTKDFEHVFTQASAGNGTWITLDPTVPAGTIIRSKEEMIEEV